MNEITKGEYQKFEVFSVRFVETGGNFREDRENPKRSRERFHTDFSSFDEAFTGQTVKW